MNPVWIITGKEVRDSLRNRWVLAAALLLAALALSLGFLGSSPTGSVKVDPLTVTVVSLSSLSIFLIPLIAMLLSYDALIGEIERGTMALLLSYPISRNQILAGKFFSLCLVGKRKRIFRTHAADKAAFDNVIGLFRIYPFSVGIGFFPIFDFTHIGNIDDMNAFRLFRQLGVAEHLLDGGKPNWFFRFAVQEDLRFRAVVFSQIHAAVMTHCAVADLLGRRRRAVVLLAAGCQCDECEGCQ